MTVVIAILDIVMDRMDGYRVFRLIQANPNPKNIPIIFLTGKSQSKKIQIFAKIKYAQAYLSKPGAIASQFSVPFTQ